jgi:internalin A
LIAITCAAITITIIARWAHQRQSALAAIRKAGGSILMSSRSPWRLELLFGPEVCCRVGRVDLRNGKADNALLSQIGVLSELGQLDLSNADIDDEGLLQIAHLPLWRLWLQETHITDASAATISRMKHLDFLQLNATNVSDEFLEHLDALPKLSNLGLRGTRVTGAGMKFLVRHPNLKELDVYETAVDDDGVAALVECQKLTFLGLSSTKISKDVFGYLDKLPNLATVDLNANRVITNDGVLGFNKLHPRCKIEWDGR